MTKCKKCGYEEPQKPYLECSAGCNKTINITQEIADFIGGHNKGIQLHYKNGETYEFIEKNYGDC